MKMRKLKRFRNLKRIIICNKRNKSNSCPIKLQQLVRKNKKKNRDSQELVNGQRKVDQSRSRSLVLRSHLKSQRRIKRRKRKKIKRKSPKVKARVNQRANPNQNQRASPNPRKNHRQT